MSLRSQTPADGLAWVTGAGTGIGRATALELARRGWRVVITARRRETLEALAAEMPERFIVAPCDVTDKDAVASTVAEIEATHGPIALAFLNAGMSIHVRAPNLDLEAVHAIHAVNVLGVFHCVGALLPALSARGRGQIALCGSVAGYGGLPRASAYTASKAAIINAAVALAIECRSLGILVQCVNPGFVDTPLTKKNDFPMPFLMQPAEAGRRCADGFARGRFEITFPRRFAYLLKVLNLLPYETYIRLLAWGLARQKKADSGA